MLLPCRRFGIGAVAALLAILGPRASVGQGLAPGKPMQYRELAIDPDRWKEQNVSTLLIPWEGREVVLLTTTAELDRRVMKRLVQRLDAAWKLYADLTGTRPQPFRLFRDKATIAAIPDASLTCGYGCGYVGATGIEVAGFYATDYPLAQKDPEAFSHYLFYEMGRNYYTFGERHSIFITGYAVFMRYVCMDALQCTDPDAVTRATIEKCESIYADSDVPFLTAFTNLADGEKGHRLKDAQGRVVEPSDQPVMYATAMLKLHKEYGGDRWTKRFFHHLMRCPSFDGNTQEGALAQCQSWLVAASAAAGKDLTGVFVDRWRMPLSPPQRKLLSGVDWSVRDLDVNQIVVQLGATRSDNPAAPAVEK